MRDLVMFALLPFLLFVAFRKPFIGLSLWLFSSLVPIQTWVFGSAGSLRWNFLFAICTMLGYLFMKNKPKVKFSGLFFSMCLMVVIATLSATFNQGFDILVWDKWNQFLKAFVFFVFIYLIVDKRLHVEALMWACVLSITATAAKQGIKVITSGGSHVVYGMSTTFSDNNLSAFATLVCIPLTLVLLHIYKKSFLFKWGLISAVIVSVVFIFGSDSRGGFLGLLVLAAVYFWRSNNKLPLTFGLLAAAVLALSLMDASWFERMNTIKDANEDGSFMGRVMAWKLSILMALNSPIWGGGFDAVAYGPTWRGLLSQWHLVSWIPSPVPVKGYVAHSIYFQVLGDMGFVGFFVFFSMIWVTYRKYKKLMRSPSSSEWLKTVSMYCTIAIVCYLVAGAALSVAYNEIILMLIALSMRLSQNVQNANNKLPFNIH